MSSLNLLKEQTQSESDEQLIEQIELYSGSEVDSMDELIDEFILIPLVMEKLMSADVNITDEEKQKYYDENEEQFEEMIEASHILLDADDEEGLQEVLDKIEAGEDFAELAEEYSTDTNSAQNGGSLDFFPKGKMVPEFEEKAFSMEVGEISEPVESDFGIHIIKVTDRKDSYEDFEEDIEVALTQQQSKTADEVIMELMRNSDIDVKDSRFTEVFELPELPEANEQDGADSGDESETADENTDEEDETDTENEDTNTEEETE